MLHLEKGPEKIPMVDIVKEWSLLGSNETEKWGTATEESRNSLKNINQPNAQLASSQPVIEMDSNIFKILQKNLQAESLPFTLSS